MTFHRLIAAISVAVLMLAASAAAGDEPAGPPVNCADAMSTHDMNICAAEDLEKADVVLNETFKKALAAIPDMSVADSSYDAKSWEAALRASQRAWIAFRDSECEGHVPMFWTGGSGTTVDVLGCKTEVTKARTRQLKERYEEGEAAADSIPN